MFDSLVNCPNCDEEIACPGTSPYYCPNPGCGCAIYGVIHHSSESGFAFSRYDEYDSEGRHPEDPKYDHVSENMFKKDCWRCPRCEENSDEFSALSGIDNKTIVCFECLNEEAMIVHQVHQFIKKVG